MASAAQQVRELLKSLENDVVGIQQAVAELKQAGQVASQEPPQPEVENSAEAAAETVSEEQ